MAARRGATRRTRERHYRPVVTRRHPRSATASAATLAFTTSGSTSRWTFQHPFGRTRVTCNIVAVTVEVRHAKAHAYGVDVIGRIRL